MCANLLVDHGVFTASLNRVNDVGTLQCKPGYQVNGSRSVVCLSTGRWSDTPNCVGKCKVGDLGCHRLANLD